MQTYIRRTGHALVVRQRSGNERGQRTDLIRSAAQIAPIDNPTHFTSLAAANNVTCGITTHNTLACWGAGEAAHLGTANGGDSTFTEIDTVHTWRRVAVGSDHVCAIATGTGAGTYCYGNTESGAIASGRLPDG